MPLTLKPEGSPTNTGVSPDEHQAASGATASVPRPRPRGDGKRASKDAAGGENDGRAGGDKRVIRKGQADDRGGKRDNCAPQRDRGHAMDD